MEKKREIARLLAKKYHTLPVPCLIENADILKGETGTHTIGFKYAHEKKQTVNVYVGDTTSNTTKS